MRALLPQGLPQEHHDGQPQAQLENTFTTGDGNKWTNRFTSKGIVATTRSVNGTTTLSAAKLSFAYFPPGSPPGSITFSENFPVGSQAW